MMLNEVTLDIESLTRNIKQCFANARDTENYSPERCRDWLVQGKILRGHLLNLVTAEFMKEAAPEIQAANEQLKDINTRLKNTQQVLQNYNDTIKSLTDLAGILERLIRLATFV